MNRLLALILHLTWCLPQTIVGAVFCLFHWKCPRFCFETSLVTEWHRLEGLSLGAFIFVPEEGPGEYEKPGPARELLVHEYGHELQSLILGPLFLPLVVLPSLIWAGTKRAARFRVRTGTSYYARYPESWANKLARKVTGEETPK